MLILVMSQHMRQVIDFYLDGSKALDIFNPRIYAAPYITISVIRIIILIVESETILLQSYIDYYAYVLEYEIIEPSLIFGNFKNFIPNIW